MGTQLERERACEVTIHRSAARRDGDERERGGGIVTADVRVPAEAAS